MVDHTWTIHSSAAAYEAPTLSVDVLEGPDAGAHAEAADGQLAIGTAEGCGLVLTDKSVSRFHLELASTPRGVALRDLGSTNGTYVGSLRVVEAVLDGPTEVRAGRSRMRISVTKRTPIEVSAVPAFGALVGGSRAMRAVFAKLGKAAGTLSTVLLSGESGTGKELAARALHDKSSRRDGPFEVVDCGGLPPTLIESELFGHVRGSFTGATSDREGAFQRAEGGTLFLDELGELPLEVQPKLLRALGERTVRPIGSKNTVPIDVRVVAATHRDLRERVNQGQFRADLYYRLAVIEVRLPPLRDRLEDLPLLLPTLVEKLVQERHIQAPIDFDDRFVEVLSKHDWPGNVRELRNIIEQWLVFAEPPELTASRSAGGASTGDSVFASLLELPLRQAKNEAITAFERLYIERLLARTNGNVAEAARVSGVDRGTLFRMFRRQGARAES